MFCQKCGTENKDGAAFCNSCGADLRLAPIGQSSSEKPAPKHGILYRFAVVVVVIFALLLIILDLSVYPGTHDSGKYTPRRGLSRISYLSLHGAGLAPSLGRRWLAVGVPDLRLLCVRCY